MCAFFVLALAEKRERERSRVYLQKKSAEKQKGEKIKGAIFKYP